jgi:nicotinamide riboside kinase
VLTTTIWSDVLLGRCPKWITEEASRRRYDLTLLTDVDIPWVADPVRYRPDDRASFLARCEEALRAAGRPYVRIQGSREKRLTLARRAIEERWQSAAHEPAGTSRSSG